jgi:hypothetical protein
MTRMRLRQIRVLFAASLAVASIGVFALFAGGGATSSLHQYQYQYQYGPQVGVGLLTTIGTICPEFQDGKIDSLDVMRYKTRRGGIVSSLDPWAFYYWARVRAPATSFTVDIVQSLTHPSYTLLFGLAQLDQVQLLSEGCADLDSQRTAGQGQARVTVSGAIPGRFYIVRVRYLTRPLLGEPAPNPAVAHYDFRTKVDGVPVDGDANGLDLRP